MNQAITTFDWTIIYNKYCKKGDLELSIEAIIELGKLLENEAKKGSLSLLYKQKKHKNILDKFIYFFKDAVYDTKSFLFMFNLFIIWGETSVGKRKLCEIIPSLKISKS